MTGGHGIPQSGADYPPDMALAPEELDQILNDQLIYLDALEVVASMDEFKSILGGLESSTARAIDHLAKEQHKLEIVINENGGDPILISAHETTCTSLEKQQVVLVKLGVLRDRLVVS
jgi:hypothetical protein